MNMLLGFRILDVVEISHVNFVGFVQSWMQFVGLCSSARDWDHCQWLIHVELHRPT
jgi:hypothetical protein